MGAHQDGRGGAVIAALVTSTKKWNQYEEMEPMNKEIARGPSLEAQDSRQPHGERQCDEVTASHALVSEGIGSAVRPAISPPVSPSTVENYKTETDGSQCGNQSGSQSVKKPNCYECKHRGGLVWDAHSECNHPKIEPADRILTIFMLGKGIRGGALKRLNISYNQHGYANGWFNWPLNFDPVWLDTCDGFEAKT